MVDLTISLPEETIAELAGSAPQRWGPGGERFFLGWLESVLTPHIQALFSIYGPARINVTKWNARELRRILENDEIQVGG